MQISSWNEIAQTVAAHSLTTRLHSKLMHTQTHKHTHKHTHTHTRTYTWSLTHTQVEAPYSCQAAFQPSSTPLDSDRRYLLWNRIGIITSRVEAVNSVVDVEFHNAQAQRYEIDGESE
jgi:hypothetical protein